MPEMESTAVPDTEQCDEKTIDSITPQVVVEHDGKPMVSSATEDTIMEQHDVPVSSLSRPPLERWNEPRSNMYRYFAANYSFIIMGMNDAATGALIPYLETYYNLDYTIISIIFIAPVIAYMLAALLNNRIHMRYGQRGVATIAPLCKIASYIVTCNHPPYPVLPVIFTLAGFANGLEDGGWNAWVGNMQNANECLGFLHGAYGLGATLSPLIATSMVTRGNLQWYTFYYVMVGMAAFEFLICFLSFRTATGDVHRAKNPTTQTTSKSNTREAMLNPITWICAVFLLGYVGIEVSLGGWVVTFMLKVRNGEPFASGLVATGFWLGITVGRMALGFVTGKVGEKTAIAAYLVISVALELCFWLIPSFVASAIFAGWLGFFLGPLFPAAIVVATKLLPERLHVSAVGFAAAFGGGGAAVFPFAVGAIAQVKGVQVLQPIVLAFLAMILALWCLLPGGFRKRGLEEVREARENRREGGMEDVISQGMLAGVKNLQKRMDIA